MKILYKYPTRDRILKFSKCLNRYLAFASSKNHEFVITMDIDDSVMNCRDVKDNLDSIPNLQYFYGNNKSKIEAINANIPTTDWDILVLISDDMIPEIEGFDNIIESTLDAVASRDYVSELLYSLTMVSITLSRLAQDLYLWYSDEWSIIDIDGDIAFSSSIMPQKKNPGTIEHIKAKSGHILGSLISNLTVQKNLNFMHCRDMSVESVEPIWNALKEITGIIILTKATIKRVKVKKSVMLDRVYKNFSTATELADILVRNHNIPFRTAHSIIGNVVAKATSKNLRANDINTELISNASKEITGKPLILSNEELEIGLNPSLNLKNKSTTGSPSFLETKKLIDLNKEILNNQESSLKLLKNKQDTANSNFKKAVNFYIK